MEHNFGTLGPLLTNAIKELGKENWAKTTDATDAINSVGFTITEGVITLMHNLPSAFQNPEPASFVLGGSRAVVCFLSLPHISPNETRDALQQKLGLTYTALIDQLLEEPGIKSFYYAARARWLGHITICNDRSDTHFRLYIGIVPLQPVNQVSIPQGATLILPADLLATGERLEWIQRHPGTNFSNAFVHSG